MSTQAISRSVLEHGLLEVLPNGVMGTLLFGVEGLPMDILWETSYAHVLDISLQLTGITVDNGKAIN